MPTIPILYTQPAGTNIVPIIDQIFAVGGSYTPHGAGAVTTTVSAKLQESVSVMDFGAKGDGVTDDTAALAAFFVAVNGNIGYIPSGTYKTTSLLNLTLNNCEIIGVPGSSVIKGAFGYAIIKLLASSNVIFRNITFKTDYVNAVEDTKLSVFYSEHVSLADITWDSCIFSSPTANTSGLTLYVNTTTTDVNTATDISITNCKFENVGRIGCTLMNRSTNVSAPDLFKRVKFDNNVGHNLGLSGSYGFLLSLDGEGTEFTVDNNKIDTFLGTGIENAGWSYGSISGNTFKNAGAFTSALGLYNILQKTLSVRSNACISAMTAHSVLHRMDSCLVENNYFWLNGTDATVTQAVLLHGGITNCQFFGNTYLNSSAAAINSHYALLITDGYGASNNNVFTNEIYDNSAGSGNFAPIRFLGATCTNNLVMKPVVLKGYGGTLVDEIYGANLNLVTNLTTSKTAYNNNNLATQVFTTDADMTVSIQYYSSELLAIQNAAVTATRNVILPAISKTYGVYNTTAQPLVFKTAAFGGITIAAGKKAEIMVTSTDVIRLSADI